MHHPLCPLLVLSILSRQLPEAHQAVRGARTLPDLRLALDWREALRAVVTSAAMPVLRAAIEAACVAELALYFFNRSPNALAIAQYRAQVHHAIGQAFDPATAIRISEAGIRRAQRIWTDGSGAPPTAIVAEPEPIDDGDCDEDFLGPDDIAPLPWERDAKVCDCGRCGDCEDALLANETYLDFCNDRRAEAIEHQEQALARPVPPTRKRSGGRRLDAFLRVMVAS